ncbi:MAG TPA: UDP-3-O-(3-hydroxymyristoyl)glucosamine N-acyltransferase [Rhodobiaceae bacterium]|nr:UDP-3-O-(3-hydroxymyristoyl)glucosamine N-acyltransferase [Rhodobiaceae bacterium]
MADPRFFTCAGPFSVGDIAARLGAQLAGDGDATRMIADITDVKDAKDGSICFITRSNYLDDLKESKATAVLIGANNATRCPAHIIPIICDDPHQAMARVAQMFYPEAALARPMPGQENIGLPAIHPDARIGENCQIAEGVHIGPGAEIGDNTHIAAHAVIGAGVSLGRDCTIGAGSVLGYALIGDRVIIQSGCRIGQCGFGFAPGKSHIKVPQLGRVIIQSDVEMGASCTIDRGAMSDTIIGEGSKLDNLVHLAHNVVLGRHVFMAAQCAIAGSTQIGDYCQLGGQTGIYDHVTLGARVLVGGKSCVTRSYPDDTQLLGVPARPLRQFLREIAMLKRMSKTKSDADD